MTKRYTKYKSARLVALTLMSAGFALPGVGFADTQSATAGSTQGRLVDNAPWNDVLNTYLVESPDGIYRFDYGGLKADEDARSRLGCYISALAASPISSWTDEEQFAAYANLYNALTVQIVAENYPVDSIRDIGGSLFSRGPWKDDLITVEGESLSLDDIEHGILRERFVDPRVHYAVNCASLGCPNLQPHAWTAESLDTDLDAAARAYINHPRGVAVRSDGRLQLSSIYRWFREDFGSTERGVIEHLLLYADEDLTAQINARPDIANHVYDWSLNDATQE